MSALNSCALLAPHSKSGKQALKAEHRPLLQEAPSAKVHQSVNFELAVQGVMPDRKRWDYFIEISGSGERLHAVEVHQFRAQELVRKKSDTLHLLRALAPTTAKQVKSWHVLAKGELPRADLLSRFKVDTGIAVSRSLNIKLLDQTR